MLCSQLAQTFIHSLEFGDAADLYSTNGDDPIGQVSKQMLQINKSEKIIAVSIEMV